MPDDVRQVIRSEETVVAGDPPATVTTTTAGAVPAVPVVATTTPEAVYTTPAVVPAPAVQQTVQETVAPRGDRLVQHQVAVSDVNPVAERAANLGWVNSLVWLIAGLIIAVLLIRFVLMMIGADPHAGFANLIYGLSSPFHAPFALLFGQPIDLGTGAVAQSRVEFETLVAMLVYALIAWGITKVLNLMLGTGRTRTTVYTDESHRTRL
jgi:hypothetical protein